MLALSHSQAALHLGTLHSALPLRTVTRSRLFPPLLAKRSTSQPHTHTHTHHSTHQAFSSHAPSPSLLPSSSDFLAHVAREEPLLLLCCRFAVVPSLLLVTPRYRVACACLAPGTNPVQDPGSQPTPTTTYLFTFRPAQPVRLFEERERPRRTPDIVFKRIAVGNHDSGTRTK